MSAIKSLIVQNKQVETDFPGLDGFKVIINYLSREAIIELRRKASKTVYKNRQPTEEINEELFLKLYTNAVLKGWSGLTMDNLSKLVPIEVDDPKKEIPYTEEDALDLMKGSSEFDKFVTDFVSDLGNFQNSNSKK